MASGKYSRRLTNFMIRPSVQLKYGAGIILLLVVLIGGIFLVSFFNFSNYTNVMVSFYGLNDDTRKILIEVTKELWTEYFLQLIGLFVVVALLVIVYSHRIYGPIYAIEKFVRAIMEGDQTARVHLRPKDQFQELGALLNEMAERMEKGGKALATKSKKAK